MHSVIATGFVTGLGLIASIGAQNAFILKQALKRQHVKVIVAIAIISDVILILGGIAAVASLQRIAPWSVTALTWGGVAFLAVYGAHSARSALFPKPAELPAAGPDADAAGPVRGSRAGDTGAGSDGPAGGDDRLGLVTGQVPVVTGAPASAAGESPVATLERVTEPADGSVPADPNAAARQRSTLLPAVLTILALTYLNPHAYVDVIVLLGTLANSHGPEGRWLFGAGAVLASMLWFSTVAFAASRMGRFFRSQLAWRVIDGGVAILMFVLAGGLVAHALG